MTWTLQQHRTSKLCRRTSSADAPAPSAPASPPPHIEGGDVGPEAQAIMNEWAQGLIDDDTMTTRVDALHVG